MNQKTENKKYKYYEIKVSIKHTHPPVWRRLRVPSGITFHQLNAIIQLAFDWSGYHLYDFEIGGTAYERGLVIELPNDKGGWFSCETRNSKREKIDDYFEVYKKIQYTYDFGDNWIHDITIEKVIYADEKLEAPICIKAKMADLPEDCGGPWGYEELLGILADEKSDRYEEMKSWLDNVVVFWEDDRTYVDVDRINIRLKRYKEHAKELLGDMF